MRISYLCIKLIQSIRFINFDLRIIKLSILTYKEKNALIKKLWEMHKIDREKVTQLATNRLITTITWIRFN